MKTRLIAGCGYVGIKAAERWLAAGERVLAITRTDQRASELSSLGIEPIVWNWLDSDHSPKLPSKFQPVEHFTTILVSVSHASHTGIPVGKAHAIGMAHLLGALIDHRLGAADSKASRWIYLSTSGVYAQPRTAGDWVDETSAAAPDRPGSMNAWSGEQWLTEHWPRDQVTILRPVGIYGPGRVPNIQKLSQPTPMDIDPQSYLNLIHVDDLASMIELASNRRMLHTRYNLSDGQPVQRGEYYRWVAELAGLPEPLFQPRVSSSTGALQGKRGEGSKRVSNHRWVSETGYSFRFPSYREGLPPLVRREQSEEQSL